MESAEMYSAEKSMRKPIYFWKFCKKGEKVIELNLTDVFVLQLHVCWCIAERKSMSCNFEESFEI